MAALFPRQGEWPEKLYLSREFEGVVEFIYGKLEFSDPLYPAEEGPPESQLGDWTWEILTDYPRQGKWCSIYFNLLPDIVRANVRLVDGCIEFPPPKEWESIAEIVRQLRLS